MKISEKDNIVIIDVGLHLDVSVLESLRACVEDFLRQNKRYIIFNLSKIKKATSVGIGLLVSVYNAALKSGGELKLVEITTPVYKLLEISKLDDMFDICDTEEHAIEHFKALQERKEREYIRKFKRLTCQPEVSCNPKRQTWSIFDGWNNFSAKTKNMCAGGIYISTNQTFPKGTFIEIRIKLSDKDSIKASALVCWSADQEKHPELYPGMGLKFLKISNRQWKTLMGYLHND